MELKWANNSHYCQTFSQRVSVARKNQSNILGQIISSSEGQGSNFFFHFTFVSLFFLEGGQNIFPRVGPKQNTSKLEENKWETLKKTALELALTGGALTTARFSCSGTKILFFAFSFSFFSFCVASGDVRNSSEKLTYILTYTLFKHLSLRTLQLFCFKYFDPLTQHHNFREISTPVGFGHK